MARNKLKDSFVQSAPTGRHGDGDGLWLYVQPTGSRSWVFIYIRDGRRREMGLGPYGRGAGQVSLALARQKADELRTALAQGNDPLAARSERKAAAKAKPATFGEMAEALLASKESGWRNAKHGDQWRMTLREYAKPLWQIPIADVSTDDVMRVVEPLWQTKQETASRLRGRIESVLDYGTARGLRTQPNVARWQGHLSSLLSRRQKLQRGHHAALPYAEVPAFMAALRQEKGIGARALEFLVLCAARSGEVLGARWDEIDIDSAVWTVPPERMKSGKEHAVPLSSSALSILAAMPRLEGNPYIFPGLKKGSGLSNMALLTVLKRMDRADVTSHGFRSTFRDWAGNATNFPRELAEEALAHTLGTVERAYRREQAVERRRKLMEAWAGYNLPTPQNVVQMPSKGRIAK